MMTEAERLERHDQAKAKGTAWTVVGVYGAAACKAATKSDALSMAYSVFRLGDVEPDEYVVASAFDLSMIRGRYKKKATAQRKADELNRYDVQGPLDPEFAERRKRLKRLAPRFGGWSFEGPTEARWPVRPGRYLVEGMDHGWHPEDWEVLADDRAAVEELIADINHDVFRVIDLDTGKKVAFERTVSVSVNWFARENGKHGE